MAPPHLPETWPLTARAALPAATTSRYPRRAVVCDGHLGDFA
jgi:hypothetical protein